MEIDLQDLWVDVKVEVEVEGDADPEGPAGNPDVRPGLQEVKESSLKISTKGGFYRISKT